MSFFNFDYDPNNPRVGDRVIVVGDEQLSQMAETNERSVPWFVQHRGGEFYIREIVAGSIYLASPLTNSINNYTWSPDWLAPAPTSLPTGTCVMVPEIFLDLRYRNNGNWASDMDRYRCNALNIRRPTTNGYFEVDGNGYSWHRDWMFIMPDSHVTEQSTIVANTSVNGLMAGDVVAYPHRMGVSSTKKQGIIRAIFGSSVYIAGKIDSIAKESVVLLSRNGQDMFVPNSTAVMNLESRIG